MLRAMKLVAGETATQNLEGLLPSGPEEGCDTAFRRRSVGAEAQQKAADLGRKPLGTVAVGC